MANLINIGVNGLLSHQSALNTTGNNITNANTPGYSRQRVELATLPEYRSGNGYMGQGSSVVGINRIVDQFLINQLRSDTSVSSQLDMLTTLYGQLDGLLADSSTGLAPALQGFFDALQQASLDPTSMPIRQVVLSAADTLAQRFGALYSQLQNQERVINEQLAAVTEQTVGLANGIARLNQQIAQQSSVGAEPNALLDKRDEMLRQLAELVGINVVDQGNGMVNVMVGNGQPLVVGNQAYSLSTQPSALDAHRDVIMFQGPGVQQEISQFLSGGQLGGLLRYRAEALDKSFNQLGQLALTVAEQFNALQISGMDLDGDYGSELPTLFADINSTELMQRRAVAIPGNTGDAQLDVAITDATALTGGEYRATMRSGSWVVTTEPGGDVVDPARHGFTLSERGTAANEGDSFLIRPTREGAGSIKKVMTDPRDLALAEPPLRITAGESNSGLAALEVVSSYPAPRPSSENIAALFSELKVSVGASGAVTLIVNGESVTGSLPPQGGVISLRYDEATDTYSLEADAFGDESPDSTDLIRFHLNGPLTDGDSFDVSLHPAPNGTSDNTNALSMLDLRFEKLIGAAGGNGQTLANAYAGLVTGVGARTAELKISQEAADSILAQAQANRDATSGVNLDEEAANLIRFEQAYNASAQVISVARTLFDSLLAAFR